MSAFATAVEAALPETGAVPDSFFLGLSCILLLGYTVFRVFGALRLPGAVGVMLAGCLLSPFAGPAIHVVLPSIQEVAFILLLCRAGCETNMADLNTSAVLLATLPLLADLTGIGLWVHFAWGATVPQGLLAGVMLAPLGEGLVLPLMHELRGEDLGPLPRLIACVAPLEGTLALFLYAFLATLGSGLPSPMWFRLLSGLVVRLAASVALGAVVGWGVARFCALSDRPVLAGRRVFVGGGVEMLLVLLGASLFSYGLSGEFSDGEPLVPNVLDLLVPDEWSMSDPSCSVDAPRARHCGGMLLQELALLCTGFFGAHFSPALAREAEALWSGLWVFGALFLFAAIGVSIDDVPAKERLLPQLLPALACGLACRFVACLCVCSATARSRQSAFPQRGAWPGLRHVALEAAFCFAAGLPRATIQGVLASRPYVEQLYPGVVVCGRELAAQGGLLQSLAQATLALMAPFGQLVLMLTARPILHRLRYSRAVLATERQIESVCDFEPPQMAILTFHQQSERGSRGIDVLGALHYRLSSVRANTILGPTVEEVSGKADSSAAASSSTLRASTVRSSTVGPPRVSQAPSREEGEAPSGKAGAVAPSEKPLQAQLGGGRLRQCLTGLDQVVALVRARNASSGTEMT